MIDVQKLRADIRKETINFAILSVAAFVILLGAGIAIGYFIWA